MAADFRLAGARHERDRLSRKTEFRAQHFYSFDKSCEG